ncbi:D-alanyl-D-alanine carboxypeptidase DacB [Aquicella siphonis]|uniref:D-alanyl-D-alanine carboxypeptidase DacB n=1 Tax=Aquicella siphonis TaxID=254247 RepID=A0A5E4PKE4_9COXI|nr:D-alanyl-D-alanine carboxypeptidase/D-alanyl-D-alanine-endopeptidase [Aquicella siphonis]VVC76871.1 D-alanyl-D-alanine carboxypeptidase DacB [Aquicella siphonis]
MRYVYLIVSLWVIFCLADPAIAKRKHKSVKQVHAHTTVKKKAVAKQKPKSIYKKVSPSHAVSSGTVVYGASQLASVLTALIRENTSTADIGVFVKSMKYGDPLYTRNIYQPLTPASTLKVLTAEAALIYLKPEYRFSTQLLTDAKTIKNGVLQGNLYVVLSGDPSLTYNDLVDLMLNLRTQQIQAIAGNVYIDNTAYDQSFYGPDWEWKDKSYCYAAPISASIINHNCLPFKVSPSAVTGQAARVETSPNHFYPEIRNSVVTKPNRTSCSLRLSSDLSSGLSIDGCMPKGKDAWGVSYVVTDVPDYNRALFKGVMKQLDIRVYGTVTFGSAPKNPSMIAYHASEPLSDLINEMLKKSDNVIAGALFKKLGQLYTHQPGSWANGSYAVSQILSRYAGMNTSGLRILDGSGLSPSNLTTPSQLMQVLSFAYHHGPTNDAFISALPIAGVDGTLKHRMGNIARKVKAKTGTISGVVSLAGYVMGADREILAFVIMINGNKGMTWKYRDMEDKIATALTRFKR